MFKPPRLTNGLRSIARGGGWFFCSRAISDAARLCRILIIARLAAPESLGTAAAALFVISAVEAFTEFGFGPSIIHSGERRPNALGTIFTAQFVRGIVIASLLWSIAPIIEAWFGVPNLSWCVRALTFMVVAKALANPAAQLLSRELRFYKVAILNATEPIVSVLVLLACLSQYSGFQSIVFGIIAGQCGKTLVSYLITGNRVRPAFDFSIVREHFAFTKWMVASQIVVFLSLQGDNAIIVKMLGAEALGIYQLAFRVAEIPAVLTTAVVGQAAFPVFSASRSDPARLRDEFFALQRIMLLVNLVVAGLIWMGASYAIPLLVGPSWSASTDIIGILILASLVRALLALGGWLFLATGKPLYNFVLNGMRFASFAILAWPLGVAFGLHGIAVAVVCGTLAAVPAYWIGIQKVVGGRWRQHVVYDRSERAVTEAVPW